jgi:hypothetical protein
MTRIGRRSAPPAGTERTAYYMERAGPPFVSGYFGTQPAENPVVIRGPAQGAGTNFAV